MDREATWGYLGGRGLTRTPGWVSCPNRMVTEPGSQCRVRPLDRFLAPIAPTALRRAN